MNSFLRHGRVRSLALLVTLQILLGFSALEGLKVLYHEYEDDCQAHDVGESCDCYLCSHVTFGHGAPSSAPEIAPPAQSGMTVDCVCCASDNPAYLQTAARSPPPSA